MICYLKQIFTTTMATTKIEFAVEMTCDSCVEAVRKCLENVNGIKNTDIKIDSGLVVVESTLPIMEIQKLLEYSGKRVAVKGYDGSISAVTMLEAGNGSVQGVVRFVQATPNVCIIDGTIDGLEHGTHHISIHECGDISQGCKSVGDVFNPSSGNRSRIYGEIASVETSESGRAEFRFEDNVLKLSDVIGRSFVISEENKNKRVACGIIARSAGLFQNPKMICACDGSTIWDEVSKKKKASL